MQPPAVIGAPQIIGWVLTAVGILASLIWNGYNQWKTRTTADTLRSEQYKLTQWSRIRTGIDGAIDKLVEVTNFNFDQVQRLSDNKSAAMLVDVINQAIVTAQDELSIALAEASKSSYCSGDRWEAAANGIRKGSETSWDILIERLGTTQAAKTGAQRLAALRSLREPVSEIRQAVQDICRVQDLELDPKRI